MLQGALTDTIFLLQVCYIFATVLLHDAPFLPHFCSTVQTLRSSLAAKTMPREKKNKLAPFREEVRQMVEQGWFLQAIIDALQTRHGIVVSRWTLYRFLEAESKRALPQQPSPPTQPPISIAGDDWKARVKKDATSPLPDREQEDLRERIRNAKQEDIRLPFPEEQIRKPTQ